MIRTDGTAWRVIKTGGDSAAIDPHFSPDGKSILFWEVDYLHLVASDGSQSPRRLDGLNRRQAVYSPDGQSIAFLRWACTRRTTGYQAAADGTASRKLAHHGEGRPSPSRAKAASVPLSLQMEAAKSFLPRALAQRPNRCSEREPSESRSRGEASLARSPATPCSTTRSIGDRLRQPRQVLLRRGTRPINREP